MHTLKHQDKERLRVPVGLSRTFLIRMPLSLYGLMKETAARERKSATLLVNEILWDSLQERGSAN